LRNRLEESQKWIGLNRDHFRAAVSCALELLGAEPLKGLNGGQQEGLPESFAFPALDQRSGADPTWADTLDTLRAPRQKDQPSWEWRRRAPIRPVVFDPPDIVTEDVVHLHLEHRIVRRLLGRFSAQGFVHHDLSRACFAQSADAIPRVVLLGRLCLYGPGAARLHEELLPVTARWMEPAQRKKALSPYGEKAEAVTLNLLEEALLKPGKVLPEVVQGQLRAAASRDITELLPHLEARGREYADEVRGKLANRGDAEADDMRDILERQREQIQKTQAKYEGVSQTYFTDHGFTTEEQRQLESNQRYWGKRLTAIEHELNKEPDRIRALYEVKAQRIEPVGLVYLWPVTG